MNTADYLLQTAEDERIAVVTRAESHTYAHLRQACRRMAGELSARGVAAGDRVGILGENSIFWIASYLATLKLGAVAVPFPTVLTPDDLQRKERFLRCRAMCLEKRLERKFAPILAPELIRINDAALREDGPSCWPAEAPTFDIHQDAALMLTSGTTALPRAVRITHRNIQANTDSIVEYLELDCRERILVVLPFYYCFGTSLLHTHLRSGGSLALCNTFAYPETALDLLQAAECTGVAGVPSTFQTLLRNSSFPTRRFPSLRKVQQAGGKLQPVFQRELMAALPEARLFTMYGQTEATARLSYLPPELLPSKLGSIGRGIPGVKLRVVDESNREVKPGEVGEIVASGDNISPGYFEDPEATREKFVDGCLRSGDLATVDPEGFIFIVDRKSDFIKSLGHRVSSQEIEAKVLEMPEVVAAAAIGQPDELQGESILVFVTLRQGAQVSAGDVLQHCRAHMARHMVPKQVFVLDRLPTNAHGKVVKSVLRQRLEPAKPVA